MDPKKFIELVEEMAKRAQEKKEAPLRWEQKLEAAASKAIAGERKQKAARHSRRFLSESDDGGDSNDEGRKMTQWGHKKQRKYGHSDSGENEKRKEKKSGQKRKRPSSNSSHERKRSSDEDWRRKKRGIRRRHEHRDSMSDSSDSDYDYSSDYDHDRAIRKGSRSRKYQKRHWRLESSASGSSTDEGNVAGKRPRRCRRSESSPASDSSSDVAATGVTRKRNHAYHHQYHPSSNGHDNQSIQPVVTTIASSLR